jgi:hypothetical protein
MFLQIELQYSSGSKEREEDPHLNMTTIIESF